MRKHYLLAILILFGPALGLLRTSAAGESTGKEKIDKLIERLGSGSFSEREKATRELAEIGVPAVEALRRAAKNDDAEVRKRAAALLPKIIRQAESLRLLAPKRIHLVYKDTPLPDALADLQKKSGYTLQLRDPDHKMRERRITLDTGETTFWHALELFCAKARLTEARWEDLLLVRRAPAGGPAPRAVQRVNPLPPAPAPPAAAPFPNARAGRVMVHGAIRRANLSHLILMEGKVKRMPTDDGRAVRIRALRKAELFGNAPDGEIILALEVSPEPKLQWQNFESIRIDKAIDDRGREWPQVIPQVEGMAGLGGGMRPMALPGGGMLVQQTLVSDSLHVQVPVQLKSGSKAAQSLKELHGIITAHVLAEEQPMIVADTLKAEKTFQGTEGGYIKIVQVNAAEKQTTIRLEFEQPPLDRVMPAQQQAMPGLPGAGVMPIRIQRARALPMAPAPAPAAPRPPAVPAQRIVINGGMAFGGNMPSRMSYNGLSVQDAKGNVLPIQSYQTQFQFQQLPGGGFRQMMTYTFVCRHAKDQDQPAKIVFHGRKRASIDIPFMLTDVPLPEHSAKR